MSTPQSPGLRIGNADREAAYRALSTHLDAGRLDVDEYSDRYAKASVARTSDEIDVLFTDLPAPHGRSTVADKPPMMPIPGNAKIRVWAGTVMGLAPFVALGLFFLTGSWICFLLIPASAVVLSGGSGRRHDRNQIAQSQDRGQADRYQVEGPTQP